MREPFILTSPPDSEGFLAIPDDEANHLTKVLRFSPGDRFVAIDGVGNGWQAEIVGVSKRELKARVLEKLPVETERKSITVAIGAVKGPRMEWAVEKAAELGASAFIPLKTRYAVVEPGEGRSRRWKNIAVAAAKQSRRLTLMKIEYLMAIADLPVQKYQSVWVFDLTDDAIPLTDFGALASLGVTDHREGILILIGPEGGFSDEERQFFRTIGTRFISLGSHPLRTETALVAALVMAKSHLKDR